MENKNTLTEDNDAELPMWKPADIGDSGGTEDQEGGEFDGEAEQLLNNSGETMNPENADIEKDDGETPMVETQKDSAEANAQENVDAEEDGEETPEEEKPNISGEANDQENVNHEEGDQEDLENAENVEEMEENSTVETQMNGGETNDQGIEEGVGETPAEETHKSSGEINDQEDAENVEDNEEIHFFMATLRTIRYASRTTA